MAVLEASWGRAFVPAWTAAMDLALGRDCSGCGHPGRILCPQCDDAFAHPSQRLLAEAPVPVRSAGSYAGGARGAIIEWKERGVRGLAPLLARHLAALIAASHAAPLTLVPIPAHHRSVRTREEDVVLGLAHATARWLRAWGVDAACQQLLVRVSEGGAHKARSAAQRRSAVRGSFEARARPFAGRVLVVDDVVTTGATLGEACRALSTAGIEAAGLAVLAATPAQPG